MRFTCQVYDGFFGELAGALHTHHASLLQLKKLLGHTQYFNLMNVRGFQAIANFFGEILHILKEDTDKEIARYAGRIQGENDIVYFAKLSKPNKKTFYLTYDKFQDTTDDVVYRIGIDTENNLRETYMVKKKPLNLPESKK